MTRRTGRSGLVAACVALSAWLTSTGVEARSAALVAEEAGDGGATDRVLQFVQETLETHGIRTQRLPTACAISDDACLKQRLRQAKIEMGVRVSMWEETPFRPDPVVSIGLFDPDLVTPYDEVFGETRCKALPCKKEVYALVEVLLSAWPERVGTKLVVEGSPRGAAVFERNRVLGALPLSVQLPRGAHRLRVSAQGYESQELLVRAGPQEEVRRKIQLQPVAAPPSDRAPSKRRRRMLVTGSVLLGIGAALMAVGVTGFARDGQCVEGDPCTAYRERSPVSAAYLGLGGASMGAGVGLLVAGKKR